MSDEKAKDAIRDAAAKGGETARKVADRAEDTARDIGDSVHSELASLREQVKKLMDERVTPALANAADTASSYSRQARDSVVGGAERTTAMVKEHPAYAIGIIAAVGVLIGCLITQRQAPPRPWYSPDRYR